MKKLWLGLIILILVVVAVPVNASHYIFKDKGEEPDSFVYRVYMDQPIAEPSNYRYLFNLLEYSTEKDKIIFTVNSYGGSASTAVHLYNKIKKCKAKTIAEVTTACSAATFIVVACKKITVNKGARMMFHTVQVSGLAGNSKNLAKEAIFLHEWASDFMEDVYDDFLTYDEINQIKQGKEVWLNDAQITKRARENHKLIN